MLSQLRNQYLDSEGLLCLIIQVSGCFLTEIYYEKKLGESIASDPVARSDFKSQADRSLQNPEVISDNPRPNKMLLLCLCVE